MQTKFDIGQRVWYTDITLSGDWEVREGVISEIRISGPLHVRYKLEDRDNWYHEGAFYLSAAEALPEAAARNVSACQRYKTEAQLASKELKDGPVSLAKNKLVYVVRKDTHFRFLGWDTLEGEDFTSWWVEEGVLLHFFTKEIKVSEISDTVSVIKCKVLKGNGSLLEPNMEDVYTDKASAILAAEKYRTKEKEKKASCKSDIGCKALQDLNEKIDKHIKENTKCSDS